jgi:diguanylate cyclase (GGDEF)-like protein
MRRVKETAMSDNGNQESAVAEQPSQLQQILIDLAALGRAPTARAANPATVERIQAIENQTAQTGMASLAAATSAEMERLAVLDTVSELLNLKAFLKELKNALKRGARYARPVSFCLISVDNLRDVGGEYGQLTSDAVLRVVGKVISNCTREIDIAGRYTADHFAIIFPDLDSAAAAGICENIRERIGTQAVSHNWKNLKITASLGLSTFPRDGSETDQLCAKALEALEFASSRGGDRLCVF